ncbi:MAG: hypothetical protein ACKO63_13920 [Nodosilinea sp.]
MTSFGSRVFALCPASVDFSSFTEMCQAGREQCFPLILEKVAKRNLNGTIILRVRATGELEGKQSELIFDIYNRLSGGKHLFPPAVGFLLDQEGRDEKQIDDFRRRSLDKIKFLPRRMYENYLLLPEAIAFVINDNDDPEQLNVSAADVEEWIAEKGKSERYLKIKKENLIQGWREQVDASKLLKALFSELSDARVQFSKPKHSLQLTKWIIEHKPHHLQDLADFLSELITENP